MIYSTDLILTTHAGSLPRPEGLLDLVLANGAGVSRSIGHKPPACRTRRAAPDGRKASEIAGC